MNKVSLSQLARLSCLFGALFSVSACEQAPPNTLGGSESPVIYGQDDRKDWYQLQDEDLKTKTRGSAVALVNRRDLTVRGDSVTHNSETLGDSYGLCPGVAFRDQPSLSHCSGTLIDDDLVLTAGHCVSNQSECNDISLVFDHLYEGPNQPATLSTDDVYDCAQVIVAQGNGLPYNVDLSVIRLARPVTGRIPAEVTLATQVANNAALVMQGFPSGLPLKVSTGRATSTGSNQRDFTANLDAFGGDSGAGVRGPDGKIFAVLVNGSQDYAYQGNCVTVNTMPDQGGAEGLMFAATAIKAMCDRDYPSTRLCGEVSAPVCGDGVCGFGETCEEDCSSSETVPNSWTCDARYYNAGDDCDCNCGAYDPDCNDPTLEVWGCLTSGWGGSRGGVCQADATCAPNLTGGWECAAAQYNDGAFCDCACGIADPDCAANLPVRGCAEGETCNSSNECSSDNSGTDTDTDTDSEPPVNTDTDTDTDSEPPVNTDTDTDSEPPVGTDTDTDTETDTEPGTDTETPTDTDTDGQSESNDGGCQSGELGMNGLPLLALALLRRRKVRSV